MGFIEYYFEKDGINSKLTLAEVENFIKDNNAEGATLEYKQPFRTKSDFDGLAVAIASAQTRIASLASLLRPVHTKFHSAVDFEEDPSRIFFGSTDCHTDSWP